MTLPQKDLNPADLFCEWVPPNKPLLERLLRFYAPCVEGHVSFIVNGASGVNRTFSWDKQELHVSHGFRFEATVTFMLETDMLAEALRTVEEVSGGYIAVSEEDRPSRLAGGVREKWEKLEEVGGVLQVEITDPGRPLIFAVKLGANTKFEPDTTIRMERAGLHDLAKGLTSARELAESGRVKLEGDTSVFLRVALIFLGDY